MFEKSYKVLALMLLLLCGLDCLSQSLDANYVMQKSMTDSVNGIVVLDYYDGLGRKSQTVNKNAATAGYDQVSMLDYDQKGRIDKKWLAVPVNGNGSFCDTIVFKQNAISYYSDNFPFAKTIYDESPLDRKIEEYGAGSTWYNNHKSITIEYYTNGNTINKCRKYIVSASSDSLIAQGYWLDGELDVVNETDEDGNKVMSFKDMRGLLILQRVIDIANSNQEHDTYYIYDSRGNLCVVLPPMASAELTSGSWGENNDIIKKYCYLYKYDSRNLCIYKKLPGCEPIQMQYDKAHRLIFLQDGNLRDQGKWLYNLYDNMGRLVVTGICSNVTPPDITYRQVTAMFAESTLSFTCYYRDSCGYVANISLNDAEPLSVNYFDYYDYLSKFAFQNDSLQYRTMSGYDNRYIGTAAQSAKGLLTGTATRVLGDSIMLVKSLYYDSHGNVIQSHENNAVGGYEHEYLHLTFTGKPLAIRHEHSCRGITHVDINTMTYDAMERLLTTTVTHDGNQVDVITNTYDDLGRLATQSCLNGQQTTAYSYNIRGWLTFIDSGDGKMRQWLHYADAVLGNTPCYNGNISAMDWNTNITSYIKRNRYCYSYDGMNRLTGASYSLYYPAIGALYQDENYSTSYTYDLNSNLTSLQRYGKNELYSVGDVEFFLYGLIDNLTITRDGNQLKKVTDQCPELTFAGAMDFKDYGGSSRAEYLWDANGNMTKDLNKGISNITYNVLNLPERITHSDGHVTYITYAADGRKLRVTYKINRLMVLHDPLEFPGGFSVPLGELSEPEDKGGGDQLIPGPGLMDPEILIMSRDYCGNYIYRNGAIERIMIANGFLQDSAYYVQLKDYQGNVRTVLNQNGTVVERNSYYPYGGLIDANESTFQPYKYSSKELDRENGLDLYDSQARWYDSMLPGTTTQDPLAEKYFSISPYIWCAGNPVRFIDPSGKDIYYFDQSGNYTHKKNKDGDNRICVITKEKVNDQILTYQNFYELADPINDGRMIDNGHITHLEFVSEGDIKKALTEQGAFTSEKINFAKESAGGGKFDYTFSYLIPKYNDAKSMLFLPENDYMAHNLFNFGNYLWGATGYVVGFNYAELKLGAHINSLISPRRNNYPSQLDSDDDQRSIVKGIYHAQKYNYRKYKK